MLRAAATQVVDARDCSSARVWLQRLYLAHPDETSTSPLMARFHATQRHPEELTWRARVVQTGPALLDDYLDWASAALRHGQVGVACETLALVPSAWRQNAGYQELSAAVSIAAGQPQVADDQLATAARLEPSNPFHAINLAALRLTTADGETRRSARSALEGYATVSPPPVSAVRALLRPGPDRRELVLARGSGVHLLADHRVGRPSRASALAALGGSYQAAADTAGLLPVAREQHRDTPKDPGVRNNFAFLSLLSGAGGPEAKRIAEENFRGQPEDPNVAATHAYALYLEARYDEGLGVLGRFDEDRMRAGGASLYLALLQQAAGQGEAATRSAPSLDPRKLLPEERLLPQKIGAKTS